ncbi:hypothetical protein AHF37_11580 [Paragonimus kellicotti]|nr:hypothetical protein AHF37_11580 [Paragonimus kellicotti]
MNLAHRSAVSYPSNRYENKTDVKFYTVINSVPPLRDCH